MVLKLQINIDLKHHSFITIYPAWQHGTILMDTFYILALITCGKTFTCFVLHRHVHF